MARRWQNARSLILVAALGLTAACGGDDGPTDPPLDPSVFQLSIVSGEDQTGLVGTVLPEPAVVEVTRRDTGAPESGVTVRWRTSNALGDVTRSSSATDQDGRASTRVVLPGLSGQMDVVAEVSGLQPVTLSPFTALPAPDIESVTPTSVSPGETVEVRVNNLPAGLTAQVLFDGVAGTITDQQSGQPAILTVEVPAPAGVCDGSEMVGVRLRVDGMTSDAISISVSVPTDPFQVGQVLVIEGTTDVQCALLPAGGGGAKYLLVALSSEFEEDGNFQVTLGGSSVTFAPADAAPPLGQPDIRTRLRAFERELAARGLPPAQPPTDPQLMAAPQVGDKRDFWVLDEVDESGRVTDFARITATLEFVGANTYIYVDDDAPAPGFTDADLRLIGETYDRRLYNVDVDYFGEPPDGDGNERVIALFTPVINSLTPPGSPGVIVGLFLPLDLFPPNLAGCSDCRFSNGGELFYGLVPDEGGVFSDPRSRERVVELMPGVMVHEVQHLIDFHFKIFVNNMLAPETLWLSEAKAHMAEELGGDELDAAGDAELADELYLDNFVRAAFYLEDPAAASLTVVSGGGSLEERGAGWLFMRWIGDQYGDFVFRRMTQTRFNGVANVLEQTGEPSFFRMFADWTVALWADDLAIPGLAERYQFPKWQLRSIVRVTPEGGGDPVYALQPASATFASIRSGTISQFIAGSSAFYIELDANGDMSDLQLDLNAMTNAGLAILRYE
jgi:hypothetical protein